MKRLAPLLAALAALPAPAASSPATPVQTITYETGPCFGRCPVYRVTISSTGSGSFEGIRFTAVTGTRALHATSAQYQAFASRLEPIQPARGSIRYQGSMCRATITDQPSVEVTWRSPRGTQSLYYYYGCDLARNRALAERLTSAPSLLPIGDFIGLPR
jgi:hypothetical protein